MVRAYLPHLFHAHVRYNSNFSPQIDDENAMGNLPSMGGMLFTDDGGFMLYTDDSGAMEYTQV